MSEQAILNPRATWWDEIQDNPCPDYGFGVKLPNSRVRVKPPGGRSFSRETANDGRTLQLSWLNRSFKCTEYIKGFFEQYEDGYFTLVDRDGGGRHYVGHFTGEFNRVQNANDSYDVRDLTFEEAPGAPMLQYPSDWTNDSIALASFNDWGQQLAATQGTWTSAQIPGYRVLGNGGASTGDFLALEYRGFGFELYLRTGPNEGIVQVLLDGTALASVDLYNPAFTAGPVMVFRKAQVSLDLHRVKVLMTGAKNANSGGTGATFCKLQVMR